MTPAATYSNQDARCPLMGNNPVRLDQLPPIQFPPLPRKLSLKLTGTNAETYRTTLGEKLLTTMTVSDKAGDLRAYNHAKQAILISARKVQATHRRLELTDTCTFDDVFNVIQSGIHQFGDAGDLDSNRAV